ncbi:MAG TPA: hypothetical protein VFI56_01985 [Vicinamibacterales bacterium]|nr:hypothetical protein [Vicinamibacterales bacterium]
MRTLAQVCFLIGSLAGVISPGFAQAPPVSCIVNAAVPPTVRSEGLTERAGDFIVQCVGVSQSPVTGTVQVFFNTNFTSRLTSGATSEALLLVDEPAPGTQTAGVNLFQGTVSGPNALTFSNVPLFPAAAETASRILRLTNLRLDASALSGSPAQLIASVSINSSPSLPLNNPVQTVAFTGPALTFSPAGSGQCLVATGTLNFSESYPLQFKVVGTGFSLPGLVVNDESGFVPDPAIAGVGLADTGTRLSATFSGLPAGASISVPATASNGSLVLAAISPAGGGSVQATNGKATVVYEVTATSYLASESVSIPFTASGITGNLVVEGSFAPVSTIAAASDSAPIPRFADRGTRATVAVAACAAPTPAPATNAYGLALLLLILVLIAALRLRAAR